MAIDPTAIWSQAQLDPSYIAAHGANTQALKSLILNYGDPTALSSQEAALYGIQPGDISAASQNPYSVTRQLQNQFAGDNTSIQRSANAHGDLFSGANAAATANEQQASGQRSYNALQALQGSIAGIGNNDTTALTGAYNNLSAAALADQTIPAIPTTDSAQPAPISSTPTAPTPVNPAALNGLGSPYVNPSLNQPAPIPVPKVKAAQTLASQAARGLIGHA